MLRAAGWHLTMFKDAATISDFLQLWLHHAVLPAPQQAVFDKYYGSYKRHFPPRLQHYYARQIRDVQQLIGHRPGSRVLEIGCGTGTESLWMAMLGASVTAVELTRERFEVALARQAALEADLGRRLDCTFINASLLDLPDQTPFDILWMEQAFHHLEPRAAIVARIAELTAMGGHVVISEANALNPLLQAQLLRRRGIRTLKHFVDESGRRHPYGDERILPAGALARLLATVGIEQRAIEHFRLFPNTPAFDRWLWLERATPTWLRPLFTHYNYVGCKVRDR